MAHPTKSIFQLELSSWKIKMSSAIRERVNGILLTANSILHEKLVFILKCVASPLARHNEKSFELMRKMAVIFPFPFSRPQWCDVIISLCDVIKSLLFAIPHSAMGKVLKVHRDVLFATRSDWERMLLCKLMKILSHLRDQWCCGVNDKKHGKCIQFTH
jgi:hypothetical protein